MVDSGGGFFEGMAPDDARIEVLCSGTPEQLNRPCVDCGLVTGNYCNWCFAVERIPSEKWQPNQNTPLCSHCERAWTACHFCRGIDWCTPPEKTSCDGDNEVISD